jgi:hypothetical protein
MRRASANEGSWPTGAFGGISGTGQRLQLQAHRHAVADFDGRAKRRAHPDAPGAWKFALQRKLRRKIAAPRVIGDHAAHFD